MRSKRTEKRPLSPFRTWGICLPLSLICLVVSDEILASGASEPELIQEKEENKGETQSPQGQTFYKWTDDTGHLYFTDDIEKVPERYRDQLKTLELPPLPAEEPVKVEEQDLEQRQSPPPEVKDSEIESEDSQETPSEPYVYKEIPFREFIRIQVGMDEAEVLSRLGFPSLITPSDYFYGNRTRYRSQIIRFIYLGNRDLNEKTTVIEIRDGRVVNTERIFPF